MRKASGKQFLFFFIGLLFCELSANAQLTVSFSADKTGGCSPLEVHFTNTSSVSSSAVYKWEFGNGNSSALKDPGAVFLDKRTYTVTLTVTDGNQTSSATKTITVYKDPVVDFTSSLNKVCTPDPTTFSATASADNGSIVNYTWDFGDGYTQNSYQPQVTHSYTTALDPTVRLSVTDDHGCTGTKTISKIIKVYNGVTAAFDADKTFICFQSDPVQLMDKSQGEGPLDYFWDFGDGTQSIEKNPSHVFNTKGIYTVKLAIQNANGCADSLEKNSYLNVGNFNSKIVVPDIICQNTLTQIKNSSTPDPTSFSFLIDGTQSIHPDFYGNYYYTFSTPGEHTITLINHFGGCEETITKKVDVKGLLNPGFKIEISDSCPRPLPVHFTDTTTGSVKSEWNFIPYTYPLNIEATGRSVTYNLGEGNFNITLFVTDSNGCRNIVQEPLFIKSPQVYIQAVDGNGNTGCDSLTKTFKAVAADNISNVTWIFDDGTTSTETEPTHTFGPGSHGVTLRFLTAGGCQREVYYYNIQVAPKVTADFVSVSGTETCGNLPVHFKSTYNYNYSWDSWLIDGQFPASGYYNTFDYQFQDTGMHTITHYVYNGGCRDTMTRVNYIHVLPSFPKITDALFSCDGDRGTITFKHGSRYAESGIWDFGDGTTALFDKGQPEISHHYTSSGDYKVVLTTTNGTCTNADSLADLIVRLKPNTVLSSSKTDFCQKEGFSYSVSGLSKEDYYSGERSYIYGYQYNDGSDFLLGNSSYDYQNWVNPYSPSTYTFQNIAKGEDSIRVVIIDQFFSPTSNYGISCLDTSNFIPIKIHGAVAGFETLTDNLCFHLPFAFKDTSTTVNTTITSRTWDFGDGKTLTTASAGIVNHTYENPGSYYVTLTVTDASGCTSTTSTVSHMVNVNGPKAAFSTYGSTFHMNVPIQFSNYTNNYNSNNTQYQWDFGDGHTSTDYNPYFTYANPGTYNVTLVATNPDSGCSDTVSHTITVENYNAHFSFTSSFINNVTCVPMLVRFTNTSSDYASVKWDFGDGFTCGNVNYPSHVYTRAGKYIVKLYVTGNNDLLNVYTDSVFVNENNVAINTNMHLTCTAQSVTLSAVSKDASSFVWDFGDGTLENATDSVSVHYYKKPGNYVPKLIAKDANGCASSVTMNSQISIDSLKVSLNEISGICAPKEVQFVPNIVNIAADGGLQSLSYHWDLVSTGVTDSSNLETPSFNFQQEGNYHVTLSVSSDDGCVKKISQDIMALQGLGATINGPSDICVNARAAFTATTQLPGQVTWKWIFPDGSTSTQQNPSSAQYEQPGDYSIQLVADNEGCRDTVNHPLQVHPNPVVTLSQKAINLCEGTSVAITASGGATYQWLPATGLNETGKASVNASPVTNTNYTVTVANGFGCSSADSVSINVIHPFTLEIVKEIEVCSGNSVTLQASGGISYEWINNTAGLNNTAIANPVAAPASSTVYTLVASGEDQCFSDTAQVQVKVKPTPVVHLGNDTTICEGQTLLLDATIANGSYTWQDGSTASSYTVSKGGTFYVLVDLNNCLASDTINVTRKPIPIFTLGKDSAVCTGEEYVLAPVLDTDASFLWQDGSTAPSFVVTHEGIYSLTATNECGSHTDSVTITKGLCSMLMPNAFSPNNDGLNDVFPVKYPFAVTHFHFSVSNRWGQNVFETTDIHEGWDGTWMGEPAVAGIYVWVISYTDLNNKDQQIKGTVTLLR
ncbi:MAG: PKD domain-containing protein [Ginsengibacter sp.]